MTLGGGGCSEPRSCHCASSLTHGDGARLCLKKKKKIDSVNLCFLNEKFNLLTCIVITVGGRTSAILLFSAYFIAFFDSFLYDWLPLDLDFFLKSE